MIKYDLVCKKEHRFEGWFASSAAFEEQAAKSKIACPSCNSKKVTKAPMAPSVSKSGETKTISPADMRKALMQLRKHVETNAEHVGPRFAEEARAIHNGDADDRPIYGDATPEESQELRDEGIEVTSIPWVPLGDA